MVSSASADDTRRAILLSGSFGKGHDTLAEACALSLEAGGIDTRTFDSMALLGSAGNGLGSWVFRKILERPSVYDAFHFSQLRTGGRLARFADNAALRFMEPRFGTEAEAFPPDLVVSVFATGAAAAARYKQSHRDLPTVVFITDTVAHRMWVHDETDLFLVVSEASAASVRRFRPKAEIAVVLAPVRPGFYTAPTQAAARATFGVPDGEPCVLLMSGGWGIGPLDRAARALAGAGYWVLAVGGSNDRLVARLRAAAADEPRVVPFGYTEEIPELMAASDAVITSSGDTCREARAVGRGLVLLDVVPGHGRENLMHELELGRAAVCSLEPESVVGAVEAFLADPANGPVAGQGSLAQWDDELRSALASVGFKLERR
jgi:processive 1,2-diacylglycerol beta-glucosyltransferase